MLELPIRKEMKIDTMKKTNLQINKKLISKDKIGRKSQVNYEKKKFIPKSVQVTRKFNIFQPSNPIVVIKAQKQMNLIQ